VDRLIEGARCGGWTAKLEAVRTAIAHVLCASPDDVAVTASASAGFSALEFTGAGTRVAGRTILFDVRLAGRLSRSIGPRPTAGSAAPPARIA